MPHNLDLKKFGKISILYEIGLCTKRQVLFDGTFYSQLMTNHSPIRVLPGQSERSEVRERKR